MSSKIGKGIKPAHTANTKFGHGDYYGTGITAKIGKMRSGLGMQEVTPSKMKKPPKSLA
jgi:hypothetical protein